MKNEICETKTKVSYEWENILHELIYGLQKSTCDLTGKMCKSAEEFKEKNAIKVERTIQRCN